MTTALAAATVAELQRRIAWMDALTAAILAELERVAKEKRS